MNWEDMEVICMEQTTSVLAEPHMALQIDINCLDLSMER